jgi:protein tyrosine/serine phosphatase
MGTLTAAGREAMRAHGIRTVIDLRGDEEVAEMASPFRDGMTYRRTPFVAARMMALHQASHDGTLPEELRRIAVAGGGLAEAVGAIAGAEPGILLHCVAGRDRTGLIVAVMLAAIDVPDDEIIADYVASDAELAAEYVRFKSLNPDKASEIDAAVTKRAWVMGQTLSAIRATLGGAGAYLRSAGVTDDDLIRLRDLFR